MNFLPSEVARLVLGYLEEEKCECAYETFLTTSPHLTECLKQRELGRKYTTKYMGMTLIDILDQYLSISSMVDEKLDKIDPQTAASLRSGTLLDKITFLLNANSSGQTMLFSITLPHGKSPTKSAVAHIRKPKYSNAEKFRERRKSRQNGNDSIYEDLNDSKNKHSDVDATPLSSLPGNTNLNIGEDQNVHKDDSITKTPKRKSTLRKSKAPEKAEESFDFSVLTKALLENHQFHEKLAENINRVRTPEVVQTIANTSIVPTVEIEQVTHVETKSTDPCTSSSIYQSSFYTELDNAFKKIVQDTESDPVFQNILQDVITEEQSDDAEDKGISHTSTPHKQNPDNIDNGSNINKTNDPNLKTTENVNNTPSKIIEDQNADAIQSIIAANSQHKDQRQETKKILNVTMDSLLNDSHLNTSFHVETTNSTNEANSSTVTTVTTTSAGISSNITTTDSNAATIYTNTSTVNNSTTITNNSSTATGNSTNNVTTSTVNTSKESILLQQGQGYNIIQPTSNIVVITQASSSVLTQPTFVLANTQYSTIDNQLLLVRKPAPQYVFRPSQQQYQAVLTERDIMAMPTVIMYGDGQNSSSNNYKISHQPVHSAPQPKLPREIVPKSNQPQPQVSITLYAGEEKPTTQNTSQQTNSNMQPMSTNVQINISPVKPGKSVPMISLDSAIKQVVTPSETTPVNTMSSQTSKRSLSSPRSGQSHVRALDFSTPPKEDEISRKANTSPKTRSSTIKKSTSKKNLKKGLFNTKPLRKSSPIKLSVPIATRLPTVKLSGEWDNVQGTGLILGIQNENQSPKKAPENKKRCWDEDLRALFGASTSEPVKENKKSKKSIKKKKKRDSLNKTEDEVSKIEEALNNEENDIIENNEQSKEEQKKEEQKVTEGEATEKKEEIIVGDKKGKTSKSKAKSTKKTTKTLKKELKTEEKPIEEKSVINEEKNVEENSNKYLRNMRPRQNRKCNIGDFVNLERDKTVFSPAVTTIKSIKNNKKTLLEKEKNVENTEDLKDMKVVTKIENATNEKIEIIPAEIQIIDEKITPTTFKLSENLPITFKTNLMPVLETPMKADPSTYPITPKIITPFGQETPFTKILNENLGSVDFSTIPTPNFPITPNFSNLTLSSQPDDHEYNRPTDYSTSSSYYQPSDCEQSQVLDTILIAESKKLEERILQQAREMNNEEISPEKETFSGKNIKMCHNLDKSANVILHESLEVSISKKVVENIQNTLDSSQSSSSCCSNSSFSCDTCSDSEEENNETVIHVSEPEPTRGYMLRPRKMPFKNVTETKKITPVKISVSKKKITKVQKKLNVSDVNDPSIKDKSKSLFDEDTQENLISDNSEVINKTPLDLSKPQKTTKNKRSRSSNKSLVEEEMVLEDKSKEKISEVVDMTISNISETLEKNKRSRSLNKSVVEEEMISEDKSKEKISKVVDMTISNISENLEKNKRSKSLNKSVVEEEMISEDKSKEKISDVVDMTISNISEKLEKNKKSRLLNKSNEEMILEAKSKEKVSEVVDMTSSDLSEKLQKNKKSRSNICIVEEEIISEDKSKEKISEVVSNISEKLEKNKKTPKKNNKIKSKKGDAKIESNIKNTTNDDNLENNILTESINRELKYASQVKNDLLGNYLIKNIVNEELGDKLDNLNIKKDQADNKNTTNLKKSPKKRSPQKKLITAYDKINQPCTSGGRIARRQTKIDPYILESLAEKRLRILNQIKNQPPKRKQPEVKEVEPKMTISKSSNKITEKIEEKAKSTTNNSKEDYDLRRKTPRKSIETIAKNLKEKKKETLININSIPALKKISIETQLDFKDLKNPKQKSVEKDSVEVKKCENLNEDYKFFEYDEIPRLHLSSDEENMEEDEIEDEVISEHKKLQDLKERGIHLIPNINKVSEDSKIPKNKIVIHDVVTIDKDSQIDLKKMESVKCIKTNLINKPIKNPEKPDKKPEKSEKTDKMNQSQNDSFTLINNDIDVQFNEKLITEDSENCFKFTYNPETATKRTLEDYNIKEIMNKKITARIYSEELEIEQDRILSITSFHEIFSFSPKKRNNKDKKISEVEDDVNEIRGKKEKITLKEYKLRLNEKKLESLSESDGNVNVNKDDDELFDLAVTGNKSNKNKTGQELNWKKRKLLGDTSTPKQHPEKRLKQDEKINLLKSLDLDQFLTKVHGPSKD